MLPMPTWVAFIEGQPSLEATFEHQVMQLLSEIVAHTITLHLLDTRGRVRRFARKHPELVERIPKKELAAYLNLSLETPSRLTRRGRI